MWYEILIPLAAAILGYIARHFGVKLPMLPTPTPAPSPATPAPAPTPEPNLIDTLLSALIAALKARFPNLPIQDDAQGKVQLFEDAAGGDALSYDAGPYVLEVRYRVRLKDQPAG